VQDRADEVPPESLVLEEGEVLVRQGDGARYRDSWLDEWNQRCENDKLDQMSVAIRGIFGS